MLEVVPLCSAGIEYYPYRPPSMVVYRAPCQRPEHDGDHITWAIDGRPFRWPSASAIERVERGVVPLSRDV